MTILARTVALIVLTCVFRSTPAIAYELRTHGTVSSATFSVSAGTLRYLSDTGLAMADTLALGDVSPSFKLADFVNDGTARGWMIEGAIREDDYQSHSFLQRTFGCTPPENPDSDIDRPRNHFFDAQGVGPEGVLVASHFAELHSVQPRTIPYENVIVTQTRVQRPRRS